MNIHEVLANTPADYLARTLALHAPSFAETPEEFRGWIERAEWEPYEHPAIAAPAQGYRAWRPGFMTIVALASLKDTAALVCDPLDAKSTATGTVMVACAQPTQGEFASYVTLLVGPEGDGLCLWTVHAGAPIRPSTLAAAEYAGKTLTVAVARALGVEWVRTGT